MPITYPGRTFSGSKNPSEWFGNVTPAEMPWKGRYAHEGGGMPHAGYIPDDMWKVIVGANPWMKSIEDPQPAVQGLRRASRRTR